MKRSQRKLHAAEQETGQPMEGLPPRSLRNHSKPKRQITKYFRAGLLVFGTITIGLIVFELFQASTQSNIAVSYTEPVATSLPASSEGEDEATSSSESTQENVSVSPSEPATVTNPTPPVPSLPSTDAKQNSSILPVEQPVKAGSQTSSATQTKPATQTNQTTSTKVTAPPKPATSPAKAAEPKVLKHRVTSGDTLFRLSRKYYGNGMGVERIAKYNGLNSNNPLPVGKIIYIPVR